MAITHSFQSILTTDGSIRILVAISYVRCTVAAARLRLSWYTDGISHEFHKNGKTYQNTDSMSLLEMKQLFMWLLHKIVKITGKWISRSIFWKKHVRVQAILWTVIAHVLYCIAHVMHEMSTAVHSQCCCCCCCCCCCSFIMAISLYVQSKTPYWRMRSAYKLRHNTVTPMSTCKSKLKKLPTSLPKSSTPSQPISRCPQIDRWRLSGRWTQGVEPHFEENFPNSGNSRFFPGNLRELKKFQEIPGNSRFWKIYKNMSKISLLWYEKANCFSSLARII